MSRFHIHIAVADLQRSISFYSAVLGHAPTKVQADYAKWQLEDPKLNFAISTRGQAPGVNHLGVQADSDEDLASMAQRLAEAGIAPSEEKAKACCYARSDKYWSIDPQGIPWETFHTLDDVPTFDGGEVAAAGCCAPAVPVAGPRP